MERPPDGESALRIFRNKCSEPRFQGDELLICQHSVLIENHVRYLTTQLACADHGIRGAECSKFYPGNEYSGARPLPVNHYYLLTAIIIEAVVIGLLLILLALVLFFYRRKKVKSESAAVERNMRESLHSGNHAYSTTQPPQNYAHFTEPTLPTSKPRTHSIGVQSAPMPPRLVDDTTSISTRCSTIASETEAFQPMVIKVDSAPISLDNTPSDTPFPVRRHPKAVCSGTPTAHKQPRDISSMVEFPDGDRAKISTYTVTEEHSLSLTVPEQRRTREPAPVSTRIVFGPKYEMPFRSLPDGSVYL